MDTTPNLDLPYIFAAQAQKHVTHNEAIRQLDALVQLGVLDRHLGSPPGSPLDGDRYIVAVGAVADWAGHDREVAAFQDGAWMFYVPRDGWLAWIADEGQLVAWSGTEWVVAGSESINPAAAVGVNTTADTTNRLAVKSDAVLFSHDDVTPGTGDQRTTLNKSAEAKTASFLFQDNWSGRAEIGLAGDDDFSFKVSPDGAIWHTPLKLKSDGSAVEAAAPVEHGVPPMLPVYTFATLPSAATYGAGSLAFVSDWPGGGRVLSSDGSRWRRIGRSLQTPLAILGGHEGVVINARTREALINDYADVLTTSGRPSDIIALTRASDATYVDRDGILKTATSDELRYTCDPATREPRGLLLEAASTNLSYPSEDLSDVAWTKSGATVSANAATAPDGATTADKIVEDSSSGGHSVRETISFTSGTTYTYSEFVKAAERSRVCLQIGSGGSAFPNVSNHRGFFDLATGTIYLQGSSILSAAIHAYPNGWYRCEITATAQASASESVIAYLCADSGGTVSYAGNGASGLFVWGPQVEAGAIASSYIPTTTAAATRAADSPIIGPDTFPVPTSGACTLYWRGRVLAKTPSFSTLIAAAGSSFSTNAMQIREGAGAADVDATVTAGGSQTVNTSGQAVALGVEYAFALVVSDSGARFYCNGSLVDTDTSLTVPTIERLRAILTAGSIHEVYEMGYVASALPEPECLALTVF